MKEYKLYRCMDGWREVIYIVIEEWGRKALMEECKVLICDFLAKKMKLALSFKQHWQSQTKKNLLFDVNKLTYPT